MFKTILCVTALAVAVPAAAAADSRVVRYDDLNLASERGVKTLERRINAAAREVCGATYDYRQSLTIQAQTQKCMAEAKARAFSDLAARDIGVARGG